MQSRADFQTNKTETAVTTQATPQSGQAPNNVMGPDEAYGVVYQNVYAPAFFEKLAADHGIRPGSDQEAVEMLTMASQLRQAHDANEKQAQANGTTMLGQAQAHLNSQLGELGYAPQAEQQQIKQAADRGATNPALAHAILSMQVAGQQAAQA
jgi:hypothetical protein